MNKSELIDAISGSSGVGKGDIDSVLKALEEVVTSAVCACFVLSKGRARHIY